MTLQLRQLSQSHTYFPTLMGNLLQMMRIMESRISPHVFTNVLSVNVDCCLPVYIKLAIYTYNTLDQHNHKLRTTKQKKVSLSRKRSVDIQDGYLLLRLQWSLLHRFWLRISNYSANLVKTVTQVDHIYCFKTAQWGSTVSCCPL